MKEHVNRYDEIIIHVSGAIILIIPAVYPFGQFIRLAPQWIEFFFITVTVIAIGISLLEFCKGEPIGKLLEFGLENSFSDKKEQPHLGNCEGTIPTPRSLSLKKVKKHRKGVQPPEGNQGQTTTS